MVVFLTLLTGCGGAEPGTTPTSELPETKVRTSDGMAMVYVPGDAFRIGRKGSLQDRAHTVELDSFWIDRTEVTNAHYGKCVAAGACSAPTTCSWGEPTYEDATKADHPVICVTWQAARLYCEWAGGRLPTEAEWEVAARGPDATVYPWGDALDGARLNSCDVNCPREDQRVRDNDDGYSLTAPVGSYPSGASWCGALDMAGNVWEWVADWHGPYPLTRQRNPSGPENGTERVIRGGSWYENNDYGFLRADHRHPFEPRDHNYLIGFRCVMPAEQETAAQFDPGEPSRIDLSDADAAVTLVLVGSLIDGTGADPLPDAALVIQGDQIIAVGPRTQFEFPPSSEFIDLPGATILPGLINTHVHNAYKVSNLETWAQAGVTTVRDLGAPYGGNYLARRDRLGDDPQCARLVAAGPLVTVPDGYPIAGNDFPSLTVTSPDDARDKINQLIDDGADVIKITLTSGSAPSLSAEEAAAIVETAHARGIPVTAHATTAEDLRRALDAGVDDVAHIATDRVSDRLIRRMVAADVSWVPTLAILQGRGAGNLRRFLKAGGRVALGNDAGYLDGVEIGLPVNEIEHLEEAGMTPMQIIVAATMNAAYVCRLEDQLGTLEPGKIADVLVVEGDPLQDLEALKDVVLVVHKGVIVRQEW